MKENMTDTSYSSAVDKLDRINDEAYIRALRRAEEEAAHEKASREYTRKMELKEAKEAARAEGLAEGKAEGLAEGKAEGLAEGKAEGLAEGKAEGLAEGKAEGLAEGLAKGLAEAKKASEKAFLEGQQSMKESIYADLNNMSTEELLRFFNRDTNDLNIGNDQTRSGGRGR